MVSLPEEIVAAICKGFFYSIYLAKGRSVLFCKIGRLIANHTNAGPVAFGRELPGKGRAARK